MNWSLLDRRSYFGLSPRRLQALYLLAAAGLAALVPLILFAGFWIRAELVKSQRDIEAFLNARATALSQRVDAEIDNQLSALRALSALPSLEGDAAASEAAARRLTATMAHWSALTLIETGTGRVVFTSDAALAARPDEALVRRAAADRKPMVETRPVSAGNRGGILLYVPVLRGDAAVYLFLLSLDASDIQDVVRGNDVDGTVSVVVDNGGRILARSLSSDGTIGQEVTGEARSATDGQASGLYQTMSREGEPITAAFQRSTLTGWLSISAVSRRESDRVMRQTVWATVAAGALSLVLAGILAVFIIHTVMERRVSDERLAASRALGELDARLLATTQGALGEQRKAASEREVLLREIYHRVKNNLQIVQSLLRLGSRDLKPEQREPFESAVRRIGAMARVHTLLYNSPDLASIDFKDYLDDLLKELSEGFGAEERAIESVLDAKAMRMPLDTAVPLAFIAVEILTNAFKHGFPSGRSGRITVEVDRDGDWAVLTIRDNGVGVGSDATGKRRLGLTIVRKLVQQIGGTLEEPPLGASAFVVRFPIGDPDPGPVGRALAPAEA